MKVSRPNYLSECARIRDARDAVKTNGDGFNLVSSYVHRHLKQFSERETVSVFNMRRDMTPNPPELRIALNNLADSIRARIGEVYRTSDLREYIDATNGVNVGVDGQGSTMISFISNTLLRELLVARRVGVACVRPPVPDDLSSTPEPPHLVMVPIEDVINYVKDGDRFIKLLLRSKQDKLEEGYVVSDETIFDEYEIIAGKVLHTKYQHDRKTKIGLPVVIDLPEIPFTLLEIAESPVENSLQAHNALLQLTSSDFMFLNKSNFPMYVEQADLVSEMQMSQARRNATPEDVSGNQSKPKNNDVDVGTITGRKYPKGTDRPGYITPPVEHLRASEIKQEKLREQIEKIMSVDSLRVANNAQQSAESKKEDKETLIGSVQSLFDKFEVFEKHVAYFYHLYYDSSSAYTVEYPKTFDLRSEKSRLETAGSKLKLRDDVSSYEFKVQLTMEAVRDMLPTLSLNGLRKIEKEVRANPLHLTAVMVSKLQRDGALHIEHVVQSLGLDKAEADKVVKYQQERMQAIQAMQTGVSNTPGTGGQPITEDGAE